MLVLYDYLCNMLVCMISDNLGETGGDFNLLFIFHFTAMYSVFRKKDMHWAAETDRCGAGLRSGLR
ncbi:hypothetical protein HanPSC8_Chr15g0687031 [Helianthus annuus]|nr:hypothetical protein HanPSC8_Chr15g0687031 [Helianthus annuus]